MNTRQLYYLVSIADVGSLSKAAQLLGISQPALSKFLIEYERSIGFPLFLRYQKRLMPTEIGKQVLQTAQHILQEQTRMLQTVRAVSGDGHSRIRLATAPNRGAILYSRIYNTFSKRYPDISLSLNELYASEQPAAILHGQIDLAIGSGPLDNRTEDLPFATEALLIALPTSHPLAKAEHIRLTDLQDTPFVLQGPKHSIRVLAETLFREANFQPVVAFESNDVILIDSMLHQGVGAGFVSQAHVLPCKELAYLPLDPPVHQTLHIRYPRGHKLTEPEQFLAGLLLKERLSDPRYTPIASEEADRLSASLSEANSSLFLRENASGVKAALQHKAISATSVGVAQLNLNTQLLQYLTAIVDEKSLTQAAEKYHLTQPSLSRHLRNAEAMLCTSLFTRVHNRLRPTNAGTVFVNSARNILKQDHDLENYIQAYRQGHNGAISIFAPAELMPVLREKVAPLFQDAYPDIHFCLEEHDRKETEQALLNASAHIGLYFSSNPSHPMLQQEVLQKDELVYVAGAAGINVEAGQSLALDGKLCSRPFMTASHHENALRAEQGRIALALFQEPPEIICEARFSVLQHLAVTHIGDSILPFTQLSHAAQELCHAFSPSQAFYLLLVTNPACVLPKPAKELLGLLRAALMSPAADKRLRPAVRKKRSGSP